MTYMSRGYFSLKKRGQFGGRFGAPPAGATPHHPRQPARAPVRRRIWVSCHCEHHVFTRIAASGSGCDGDLRESKARAGARRQLRRHLGSHN